MSHDFQTGDIIQGTKRRWVVTGFFGQRKVLKNGDIANEDFVTLQSADEQRLNISMSVDSIKYRTPVHSTKE